MRILVIGSGGREHALAWKLAQSPRVETVFIAPGNGGSCDSGINVDISATNIQALVDFARKEKIDLVVPGPEAPLTLGIADAMLAAGIDCFGPDKFCAQLEGSKSFAKRIMAEAGVPTAQSEAFTDPEQAKAYAQAGPDSVVVKADGLAAGKGVIVAESRDDAIAAIGQLRDSFGEAGATLLIEERLFGEEISLLCLCDGETAIPLASAQDHKAAYDHDQGPNTGGMGAYSPAPLVPDSDLEDLTDLVIRPVLKNLAAKGHPFRGVLYAGLMITADGPKVLEYNVRFGDPECQPLLFRLKSDLAAHLIAACRGKLAEEHVEFEPETALSVVIAAGGYPGEYEKGMSIGGLNEAEALGDVKVFHSGTARDENGVHSTGGRVLAVTARGTTLPKAQDRAYQAAEQIKMPGSRYRADIGAKGIMRLKLANL